MRAIALAVIFGGLAVASAQGPDARPKDGYWKPESVQFDGKEQLPDAKAREPLVLILAGSEYRMYYTTDAKAGKAIKLFVGDFKADPTTRQFELEVKDGQRKGMKVHGIYEVNGTQMKMCYGPSDQPRPTKFEAPAGSKLFSEVWSYMNPQPKAP